MNTPQPAHRQLGHEPANVFGDPWNEPASVAVKVRTTVAFVIFIALVALFAATASAWVSSLRSQAERPAAVSGLKANDAGRAARSPIPVLAPSGMTPAQAAEFSDRLRVTPDGYFSQVSLVDYDVVVDGSVRRSNTDSAVRVSETERGLAVIFGRDGGDYLIEFVCRGAGSEAGASCVAEADALEQAAAFVPLDENAP